MSIPVTAFSASEGKKSTTAILVNMNTQKKAEASKRTAGLKRPYRYS